MADDRNYPRVSKHHLYTTSPGEATRKQTRLVTHPCFSSLASTRSHVAERDSIPSSTLVPAIFCWRQKREKILSRLVILISHSYHHFTGLQRSAPCSRQSHISIKYHRPYLPSLALDESMHQLQYDASREPLWYDTLDRSIRFDARRG